MQQGLINYRNDEALQEIHDEMYQREDERNKSKLMDFDQRTKFFIALAAAALLYLLYTQKISAKEGFIFGFLGFIVLFIVKGTETKRHELTWIECQIRINELLKFLQAHPIGDIPQVPKGAIGVLLIGRKQWYEGKSFKRSFGVTIYDRDTMVDEYYFVEIDVFTGDIITFMYKPDGIWGDETKDVKVIPSYDMLMAKKREQYLGRKA